MRLLFYVLWYAAPLVKAAAAYRHLRNGIARTYPMIWALIVLSAIRTCVLVCLNPRSSAYANFYAWSAPVLIAMESCAALNVFAVLIENYPRMRRPGILALFILAIFGLGGTFLGRGFGVPMAFAGIGAVVLLVQRQWAALQVLMLVAARILLPRSSRPSARRATDILAIHAAICLASGLHVVATNGGQPLLTYYLSAVDGLGTALLWCFWLTPASNRRRRGAEMYTEAERRRRTLLSERLQDFLR